MTLARRDSRRLLCLNTDNKRRYWDKENFVQIYPDTGIDNQKCTLPLDTMMIIERWLLNSDKKKQKETPRIKR